LALIDDKYNSEKYNIRTNNCNHFTNDICLFLTGKGLPDYVSNQIDELMETKLGQSLIPYLEKMGKDTVPKIYENK